MQPVMLSVFHSYIDCFVLCPRCDVCHDALKLLVVPLLMFAREDGVVVLVKTATKEIAVEQIRL